jgi:hypothetical protein
VFWFYNALLVLALALCGGGRYDWAYTWGALLLGLNALPFLTRLIRQRGRLLGRGPAFWLLGVLLPWCAFGTLFYGALNNPSHELLYPNNLFSPLIPLSLRHRPADHATPGAQPPVSTLSPRPAVPTAQPVDGTEPPRAAAPLLSPARGRRRPAGSQRCGDEAEQ